MTYRIFYAIDKETNFSISSKILEGEATQTFKDILVENFLKETSYEKELDPSTIRVVECNRSGEVLKHYFGDYNEGN